MRITIVKLKGKTSKVSSITSCVMPGYPHGSFSTSAMIQFDHCLGWEHTNGAFCRLQFRLFQFPFWLISPQSSVPTTEGLGSPLAHCVYPTELPSDHFHPNVANFDNQIQSYDKVISKGFFEKTDKGKNILYCTNC